MGYFVEDVRGDWDGRVRMVTVLDDKGKPIPDLRQLLEPIPCGTSEVPVGFISDGASSGVMRYAGVFAFPKHKHPIAFFRHDCRCAVAKNKAERKFADAQFKKDVGKTGTKWEALKGHMGVRLGAIFGVGSNF